MYIIITPTHSKVLSSTCSMSIGQCRQRAAFNLCEYVRSVKMLTLTSETQHFNRPDSYEIAIEY